VAKNEQGKREEVAVWAIRDVSGPGPWPFFLESFVMVKGQLETCEWTDEWHKAHKFTRKKTAMKVEKELAALGQMEVQACSHASSYIAAPDDLGGFVARTTRRVHTSRLFAPTGECLSGNVVARDYGEILFPDGTVRKWSMYFQTDWWDQSSRSFIRVDLKDWRKRKDARQIRRAIMSSKEDVGIKIETMPRSSLAGLAERDAELLFQFQNDPNHYLQMHGLVDVGTNPETQGGKQA